jgi:ribosomal protein L1
VGKGDMPSVASTAATKNVKKTVKKSKETTWKSCPRK